MSEKRLAYFLTALIVASILAQIYVAPLINKLFDYFL